MTRRPFAVICIAFALIAVACVRDEPQVAGTPEPVSSGRKPVEKSFARSQQGTIVWQNTAVDIEPVSRYRENPGGNDIAHITTVMALTEAADSDFEEFLKELDDVDSDISEDGRIVTLRYDVEVPESAEEANQYGFEITAPVEFVELEDNGDVSVTVLLPRPAIDYDTEPNYDVQLVSTDGNVDPQVFEPDEESQRIGVFWYKRGDPPWEVVYRLIG